MTTTSPKSDCDDRREIFFWNTIANSEIENEIKFSHIYIHHKITKKKRLLCIHGPTAIFSSGILAERGPRELSPTARFINFFLVGPPVKRRVLLPLYSKRRVLDRKKTKKTTRLGTNFGSDTRGIRPRFALPARRVPRGPHRGTRQGRAAGALSIEFSCSLNI